MQMLLHIPMFHTNKLRLREIKSNWPWSHDWKMLELGFKARQSDTRAQTYNQIQSTEPF